MFKTKEGIKDGGSNNNAAQTFTFRELAAATKNFRGDCLLGEGGFGRVYKGRLETSDQVSFVSFNTLIYTTSAIRYVYFLRSRS